MFGVTSILLAFLLVVDYRVLTQATPLDRDERSVAELSSNKSTYLEILRGRDGRDGRDGGTGQQGPPGERGPHGKQGPPGPASGGLTYTRWGHNTCPDVTGTELLYSGRLAGTFYNTKGGGANHLCLPDYPEYTLPSDVQGVTSKSYRPSIYGGEYQNPLVGQHDHGVPCAVCYTSTRSASVMIPAKTSCPPNWTREYYGYIMSEGNFSNRQRSEHICVDKDQVSVPGTAANQDGVVLYHVEVACHGIQCPPYDPAKELNCVVCSK